MKRISIFLFFIYCLFFYGKVSSYNVEEINNDLLKSKYNNEIYLSFYKIPLSLMTFTTNGQKIYMHDLSYAFDNDHRTYWQTNRGIKANIKITFSKTITFDRMIYKAPLYNGIEGYGYPVELEVYYRLRKIDGTLSDDESDFLLFDVIISEKTGNYVLFTFSDEITCDHKFR